LNMWEIPAKTTTTKKIYSQVPPQKS
jgi:hypothetical protein